MYINLIFLKNIDKSKIIYSNTSILIYINIEKKNLQDIDNLRKYPPTSNKLKIKLRKLS